MFQGGSPAWIAASTGQLPCLQLLAELRADLDAKENNGSGLRGEGKGSGGEGEMKCSIKVENQMQSAAFIEQHIVQ